MKKRAIVFLALPFVFACNNSSNDSVQKADSANESKSDTATSMTTTDTTNKMSTTTMQLIDAPLHHNFYRLSQQGRDYDISKIFENTLISLHPELTISFVSNHDSQPLQLLEKPIAEWCNPLAYAIILLREQGIPCNFYPDLYGAEYTDKGKDGNDHYIVLKKVHELPALLLARKFLAYGKQRDYFDHKTTIGWTREGTGEKRNSGCAVLLSGGDDGWKYMFP